MFAIKFQTTDCPSTDGTLISREGQWHWIVNEPDGWVWGTSISAHGDRVAGDVKTFTTKEAALEGQARWKKDYHPWYGKPNGVYEIVELEPTFQTTQTGWKIK